MEVRGNERADCLASKAVVVNGNVKTMDRGYYILNAISIPDNVVSSLHILLIACELELGVVRGVVRNERQIGNNQLIHKHRTGTLNHHILMDGDTERLWTCSTCFKNNPMINIHV